MDNTSLRDKLAFIICTEAGKLERKSEMLVRTLRRNGGRLKDCSVISYSPRKGRIPGERVLRFFEEHDVQVVMDPINTTFEDYGFANKIFSCAHAERNFDYERFVFLDSDLLVLADLGHLWSDDPAVVKIGPVEKKKAGSDGSDEYATYWEEVFRWAGVADPIYVTTSINKERIYGYWNTGVISAAGKSGFYGLWLQHFRGLMDQGVIHPDGITFMEQLSAGISIHQRKVLLEPLPIQYNYPINWILEPPGEGEITRLDQLVIVHYHKVLDAAPLRNPLGAWLRGGNEHAYLNQVMKESGLYGINVHLKGRMTKLRRSVAGIIKRI